MAIKYIQNKTSRLYKSSTSKSVVQILIYGEEVTTSGSPKNGRIKALYRGKYEGWVIINQLMDEKQLEVYFIDVGQGDASLIVTPNNKKILVDGGYNNQTLGFLLWKYELAKIDATPLTIDLLILSHADSDHLKGLLPILEHNKINVKKIIHNGIGLFKGMDKKSGDLTADGNYLVTKFTTADSVKNLTLRTTFKKWITLITDLKIPCDAVDSDSGIIDIDDPQIELKIIGPRLSNIANKKVFKWFGNHSHTINGHSLLFSLQYNQATFFFSGDINTEGSEHLLEDTTITNSLKAHVFKTPHHGSHDYSLALFKAINPQISVVSSGDSPDHGHPRANFLGALGLASRTQSPLLFSTEIASTFADAKAIDLTKIIDEDKLNDEDLKEARLFKKKLNGMINVRTNGTELFAMRRVQSSYWWEAYGPIDVEN